MEDTGERFISSVEHAQISYEHWHRYMYASTYVAGKRVLDIACGDGYGSDYLAQSAAHVTGVDISEEAVTYAKDRYKRSNLEYLVGSAAAIPIEGEHLFDVIVSYETIEHIPEEDQVRFLAEAKRLLTPEGVLIISTPDKKYYTDIAAHHNEFHIREFYEEEFRSFLEKAFTHVAFLGQKVIAGSHIWDTRGTKAEKINERFIGVKKDGGFGEESKNREQVYFIAICSQEEQSVEDSVLIDVSSALLKEKERAISEPHKRLHEAQLRIVELDALNNKLQGGRVAELEREIAEMKQSKFWKLRDKYMQIKQLIR